MRQHPMELDERHVALRVRDTSSRKLPQPPSSSYFERLFTARAPGRGLGLGLAILPRPSSQGMHGGRDPRSQPSRRC